MMNRFFLTLLVITSFIVGYSQPTNIDFSTGNLNGWTFEEAKNLDSYFMTNGTFSVSSNYGLMMPGVLESNNVPVTMLSSLGGKFMRIGNTTQSGRSYKLKQTFRVNSASEALAISYAIVAKSENHFCNDKPYFDFVLRDSLGNIIPYSNYRYTLPGSNCLSGDPSFSYVNGYNYKNWITKNFSLQDYLTTNVTIEFIASGSTDSLGTDPLYAYIDASICNNSFSPNILSVNTTTYNLNQSQNSILVCGTTTANIIAPNGASSYAWTGTGVTGLTTQSVSITQAGYYQLIFNKSSACSNSTSVSFTVGSNPTLTVSSPSSTICEGIPITMTVTGASNYSWTPFFNDTTGYNTNFSPQNTVYLNTSTNYTVYGIDINGCVSSSQFSVTVVPKPILSITGNTTICLGNSSTLTASGANTYTWTPGSITGSTVSMAPTYNTQYTASGTDVSTGCTTSKNIDVLVNRNIQDNYLNANICNGDSITLTAIGATSYTWSNGVTTNTVVLKPTSLTVYTLSGTSSCGITQNTFTIGINALPNVVANATQTFVCKGLAIKLFGNNTFLNAWSNGVINNVFFTPTVTATYTVVGTDSYGCKNVASITVSVVPTPTVTISAPTTVLCAGQSITLTALGANSYTWNTGANSSTIAISPIANTNYNVTGKNIFGCVKSSSVTSVIVFTTTPTFSFTNTTPTVCALSNYAFPVQQPSGSSYIYSYIQPSSSVTINGLALNPVPIVPSIYTITANNGCGSISHTVQVIPQSLPVLSIASPDSVCAGTIYSYSLSGADIYQVNTGPYSTTSTFTAIAHTNNLPPMTIYLFGEYLNGCYTNISKQIKVVANPTLSISGNGTLTCASCTTNLIASGASTYTWNTGATTSNIFVTPTSYTTYTVVGSDVNGCVSSAKTIVIVSDSLTMCFTPMHGIGGHFIDYNSADFNGDGNLDIAVSSYNQGYKLLIYMNSGNGNFSAPTILDVGYSIVNLKANDINNDSFPDIVLTTQEAGTGNNDFGIIAYLNDGSGNFLGPNRYSSFLNNGYINWPISIGDVTGDGFLDIVSRGGNGLVVFKNTGVGSFNVVHQLINNQLGYIYLANLNSDNASDLISVYADTTIVFLNDGIGNYLIAQKYSAGSSAGSIGNICDINSDSNLDIVVASSTGLSLLINNGNGTFALPINYPIIDLWPTDISSVDFNNDGFPDLVTSNNNSNINAIYLNFVQVFMNKGNNTFHSPVNYYPSNVPGTFVAASLLTKDINSDLKPDIVTVDGLHDSIVFLLNSITPLLTITPQTNSVVCAGSNIALTASGANTYTWSGGISNGVSFNPSQTETFTLSATDISGCSGYAVATVSVSPNLSVISSSPYICNGSIAGISANGADTYSWSTGANTTSVSVSPTTTTVYSVTGSDIVTGCSYTKTLSLIVDSCESVWPGDANNDGIADNIDVLELGLHYTQTGFARATVSNVWQSFPAPTWTGTISNGNNLSHSDCNGDGIINNNDTLAIYNNYGLTHPKTTQTTTVNPQLSIVPNQAMVAKGSWGTASVYLGDAANTINTINGVAFTVDFDNTLIEPNSIYIEYQNSFIDASQNLYFRKLDFANSKLFTATTHTINNNVSGFGKIATLHYQILSSLTTDQVLNIGLSQANQSNASGVITSLTTGTGTLMAIGASVGLNEIVVNGLFAITPNPTNGALTITSNDVIQNIVITNIAGQVLLTQPCFDKTQTLQLQNFAEGIYFVKVVYDNGRNVTKKVIVNH